MENQKNEIKMANKTMDAMKVKKVAPKKSKLEKCFDELKKVNAYCELDWIVKLNRKERDIQITGSSSTIHCANRIFSVLANYEFHSFISTRDVATVVIY